MNIEKALFNLQKTQIIQSKINSDTSDFISNDYAYAWNVSLFPLLESSDLHLEYEEFFDIKKEEIDSITDFADKEWLKNKYYTFYEYEDMFIRSKESKIKTERFHLLAIFRYMFLRGSFDKKFWEKLLENGNCPIEAFSISRDFEITQLSLV